MPQLSYALDVTRNEPPDLEMTKVAVGTTTYYSGSSRDRLPLIFEL